jgi:hypothetical protein
MQLEEYMTKYEKTHKRKIELKHLLKERVEIQQHFEIKIKRLEHEITDKDEEIELLDKEISLIRDEHDHEIRKIHVQHDKVIKEKTIYYETKFMDNSEEIKKAAIMSIMKMEVDKTSGYTHTHTEKKTEVHVDI